MTMKSTQGAQQYELGKKMIESAVALDEGLAELLKVETKRLKKILRENPSSDELSKANNLIKNIILALTLTEEKMQKGVELCKSKESSE